MSDFIFSEMTPELQVYLDHQKIKPDDYQIHKEKGENLKFLLPQGLLNSYIKGKKIWTCRDENANEKKYVKKSPSEKYELHITNHATGPGTWGYSKGKIFEGIKLIAEVCRNYGAFPHLFVEDHPKGEFLIAGHDYQGSTVADLKSGQIIDFLPEEAEEGHGFCWAEYKFDLQSQILVVEGCYWACPYEFRFYDFSDPMNGWPELKITDNYVDADKKWPTIESDGTIKCYQTKYDDSDDEEEREMPVMAIKTFKREGQTLILFNEWVSDEEKEIRTKREESDLKYEQWLENYKLTDPLWLKMTELIKDRIFSSVQSSFGIGVTHEKWCPDFKGEEKRICKRIANNQKASDGFKYTIDLEWAHETGPIKLIIYKDGQTFEDKFFEHNEMETAFLYAKTVIS